MASGTRWQHKLSHIKAHFRLAMLDGTSVKLLSWVAGGEVPEYERCAEAVRTDLKAYDTERIGVLAVP